MRDSKNAPDELPLGKSNSEKSDPSFQKIGHLKCVDVDKLRIVVSLVEKEDYYCHHNLHAQIYSQCCNR